MCTFQTIILQIQPINLISLKGEHWIYRERCDYVSPLAVLAEHLRARSD